VRKSVKRKEFSKVVSAESQVPEWELLVYTPAVFVPQNRPGSRIRIEVASKGLTGYGTWECVRKMGDSGE